MEHIPGKGDMIMVIYTKNKLTIRELEEQDAPKLVEWLSNPRLLEFYEGRDKPHDLYMVKNAFYQDSNETRCMVEYDGLEIGYIQFYEIDESEKRSYFEEAAANQKIMGTDQFIGETSYWNQGIGTVLIQSILEYLTVVMGAVKVIMDPQARNHRAIACYKKCGFRKVKHLPEHEWHEGEKRDCWLMEYAP
jgi:aminoglycoside 6'-N-acetyltransferase